MMWYAAGEPASYARWALIALAVALISLILLLCQYGPSVQSVTSPQILSLQDLGVSVGENATEEGTSIPNIVHFAHLVNWNATDRPVFEFHFRQFIAIYSAWYYLRPHVIYVHTNVEEHLIDGALWKAPNPIVQAISKIPKVKFIHHAEPKETTSGREIEKMSHKSDFIRTGVLYAYGDIWLDEDAYILKDLKPLRHAGFRSVLGRQANNQICPAVMLSSTENDMLKAYHVLQHKVFDGSWTRHAVDLLTSLSREYQNPYDLLIVPQDTFFPASWSQDDLELIYGVHEDEGAPAINNRDPRTNLTEFVDSFEIDWPNTWRRDWRFSYVLHGWNPGIKMNMDEEAQHKLFGELKEINLTYVMANNSNFARAVYPAVKHALDNDFLKGHDSDGVWVLD